MLFCVGNGAFASQAPNPRAGTVQNSSVTSVNVAPQRAKNQDVVNVSENNSYEKNATSRSAAMNVSRSAATRPSTTVARSAVPNISSNVVQTVTNSGRSAVRQNTVSNNAASTSRAASTNVVRSASLNNVARSTARSAVVGASRASSARATAVFDDISKIGGGYANCREAYATCMDQFCANANDTYRRCFCSSRFTEFRDIENALDEAVTLLAQFEDNNLNAVDKTAEEVAAMYSATEGERAIKKDTSAAASMLEEIGDLLSGNKKASSSYNSGTSLGVLSLDFSTDLGDIWGGSSGSIFDNSGSGVDLASLEGQELYTQAQKQCLQLITDSCENNAVLSMAKSAYSILITQDCNTYEKKINSQKETLQQTVRTAEKYLREARLEEYRSHNSADVNECITKVKNALTNEVACGTNYKKCLDYTGAYINPNTGDAIYSPRLFQLQNLILLDGTSDDVLGQNPQFNSFLDSKKMFAETALDTCRDLSDIVWEEFKRQALIEIAQAQDEKIEEVKMSCVSTMSECYDTQTSAVKDFDNTTSQYSGAISAYAAKEMCQDKVIACASLYGDTENCEFDGNGKLTAGNSVSGLSANEMCGLTALLAFVDSVDTVRVTEGCEVAVESYVEDLCTPTSGNQGFPWKCRTKIAGSISDKENGNSTASLAANIKQFAVENCGVPGQENTFESLPTQAQQKVDSIINDVIEKMDYAMMEICESLDGYWLDADSTEGNLLKAFYSSAYAGSTDNTTWGRCVENSTRVACLDYNETDKEPVASYDLSKDECSFTDDWYKSKCSLLGNGYYENGVCYVSPNN